jgi:hypothetical protein
MAKMTTASTARNASASAIASYVARLGEVAGTDMAFLSAGRPGSTSPESARQNA